jgi:hypothetical protein
MPGPFPRGVRFPFHAVSHMAWYRLMGLNIYLSVFIASLKDLRHSPRCPVATGATAWVPGILTFQCVSSPGRISFTSCHQPGATGLRLLSARPWSPRRVSILTYLCLGTLVQDTGILGVHHSLKTKDTQAEPPRSLCVTVESVPKTCHILALSHAMSLCTPIAATTSGL